MKNNARVSHVHDLNYTLIWLNCNGMIVVGAVVKIRIFPVHIN